MFKLSREEILHGNIYKGLIKVAIPLIFLSLINTFYGIVDTYFVGQIGELEVGAVSMITPITACATSFCEGLCVAGISLISISIGKKEFKKGISIANILLIICIALGVIACILLLIFGEPLLVLLKTPSDIFNSSYNYLFGISFDFVFLFTLSMYHSICQAHGDSKSGVIVNSVSAIINCLLDPLFIYVFKMGTLGAALATCLSKVLLTPFVFINLYKRNYIDFKHFSFDKGLFSQIFKISLPSSFGHFLSSFGFVLMQKEIAVYGSIALSAYGVGNKISSIYNIFVYCWGNALVAFVGTSLGAKMEDRSKKCFRSSMLIVFIISLILIPLGFLTSKTLINIFIKNISDELLALAIEYTYFSIFTSFFMGWMNNLIGVFNGSGNTRLSMLMTGSRIFFIRIPLIKLLNAITSFGVSNIWIAMCLSNLIVCIIGNILYFTYDWKKIAKST